MARFFQSDGVYDGKALIGDLLMFGFMIAIMYFTHGAGFILFVAMAIIAVMQNKTERMLLLMMMANCALIGNGVLMPKSFLFAASHKILMVIVAVALTVKLAGRKHSPLVSPLMGIFPYVLYMTLSSTQGWCPAISYLKLFFFTTTYFAFYSMANTIILDMRVTTEKTRSAYLSLFCVLIIGSVLLVPFPGISQLGAEKYVEALKSGQVLTSLFCGMTFHSQALGPLIAVSLVILLSDMLFSVRRANKVMIVLMLCCPYLIYLTSSRTAMGSVLAGALFVMYLFMKARGVGGRWRGKVMSVALLLATCGSLALLVSSSGREGVAKFVLKSQDVQQLTGIKAEDVVSSRQGLMDEAMYNFKKKPLLGNGFQVSEANINTDTSDIRNILTAPVEKGVWITAILEEGGVVGMFIFLCFAFSALTLLIKRHAYTCASVLFTIFVVNLGEFTMFAMSGIGGYYWCLCFIGAVVDAQRLRTQNLPFFSPSQPYSQFVHP